VNPVELLKKELTVSISNKGVVQSINYGIMNVVVNNSLQKWAVQKGL
jgi:hypothetical protein